MTDQNRKRDYFRISPIPLLVLALGLAATAVVSYTIRTHERREVSWATKLAADAIKIDLTTDVQWQLFGLDRLALLWEAQEPIQPLWTKNAELYIQHRPGAIAVEWISADAKKRQVVYAIGRERTPLAFGGIPTSLMKLALETRVAMFSGTVDLPDTTKQWAIAYPVFKEDRLLGFVVSFFDFDQSLGYIVEDLAPLDFSFEVSQGEQHLFLKPGGGREYQKEWGTTAEIPLPGGRWELRVWPNPTVVDRIKSRLPEAILLGGSLIFLLIGCITHLMISVARSNKRIQLMNEELRQEIASRTLAQEHLVRAQDQLELRVQERTAELADTNKLLEREIEEHQRAEDSLRQLNARLFHLQDEERRRLARELHDGATQELVALGLNLETFRRIARDTVDVQTVNECAKLIQQCTTELRTISYLLHPPYFDELGLVPALRTYVEGFAKRSGIQINLEIEDRFGRLGHETELTIFRVVQEALANVHRHSQSRTATLLLFTDGADVRVEITDNGKGIHRDLLDRVQAGLAGMGTAGMLERIRLLGGRLEITSDGSGTCVRALVPMPKRNLTEVQASVA